MYLWMILSISGIIAFLYICFLIGIALLISRKLTMPPRQKQKKQPSDYGLIYESIEFKTAKDYHIRGWLVKSRGPSKGTLVMCHNYKASKQKLLPWIRFICNAGYEVVAFDFNGHGESDRAHTWWGAVESTVLDLETVMSNLDRLPLSNRSRIGLMGFSMGSMPAIGYLEMHGHHKNVNAVVIDSGPPHPSVWHYLVDLTLNPHLKRLPFIRLVHHLVQYWQRFENTSQEVRQLSKSTLELEIPFFFIHGLKDNICLPEESYWLYSHLTRSQKNYWSVPEAYHLTILTLRKQEYHQRLLRFLDRFLASSHIPETKVS